MVTRLRNDAAISSLVGTRIYPHPAPPGTACPFITWDRPDTPSRLRTIYGYTDIETASFDLNCWAEQTTTASAISTVIAMRDAVIAMLLYLDRESRYRSGALINGNVAVKAVVIRNQHRMTDDPTWRGERWLIETDITYLS